MENNYVAREGLTKKVIDLERLGDEGRYLIREYGPLGEWWKIHIFIQHGIEHDDVASLDDPLSLYEAMRFEDASK